MTKINERFVRADADETEAEKKAREDKARKDASAGTQESTEIMDAVTRCMDACERMADGFEKYRKDADARMDAMERKDSARKDEDESEEDKKKREDAAKADAEGKEEAEKVAADKARKDAEEKEKEEREDKARKDAAKKDAEGKEGEREEHADSIDMAKMRAEIATLKGMIPRQITDEDGAALASRQAIADSVFIEGGARAPAPLINEDLSAYRRRLAIDIQKTFGVMKGVDFWKVADAAALDHLERQLYLDAVAEARKPTTVGPMQVRGVKREEGGHTFIDYHGDSAGWMGALSIPAVRGFATVSDIMKNGHGQR